MNLNLNLLIEKLANGGIFIKPSRRGLFTRKAKAAGMGVQEYANHVLSNKEDFNKGTEKQAQFSKNAKSFNH